MVAGESVCVCVVVWLCGREGARFCFVLILVFITRYMRPEGPWQWRAFLNNLFLPQTSSRRHSEVSPPSTPQPLRENK